MNYPTQKNFTGGTLPASRSRISLALLALGTISLSLPAQAVLTNGSLLTIVRSAVVPPAGQQPQGSWFSMLATDTDSDQVADANVYTKLDGFNGLKLGTIQLGGGSHGGAPNGTETLNIDKAWGFFNSTGLDYTTVATNVLSASGATATADLSGWHVHWNGLAIPMTGGAWEAGYTNGVAKVTCTATCADGEDYTLDYSATVPPGSGTNFTGVKYHLHLVGKVVIAPVAVDDTSVTTVTAPVNINVLANDSAAAGVNPTTVTVVSPALPGGGTAVADPTTGIVTYTPPTGAPFTGTDTFTYTFQDNASTPRTSNSARVTVTVRDNSAPIAMDDIASVTAGTSTVIDVLANDTDPDGTTPRGNIDPTTVVVTVQPVHGTVSVNGTTGEITYNAGTAGLESFTYTVRDTDNAISNPATVNVAVNAFTGDWTIPIAPGDVPILFIEDGSYFNMYVSSTIPIKTNLFAGVDKGIVINREQFAGGSHQGGPNGTTEVTGVDQAWNFFNNTGMHFSSNGGIIVNDTDGTLNFDNRWFVTWNEVPAINMGGSNLDDAAIRGRASIVCTPAPCANGSAYTLNYNSHVPNDGLTDFGGVPYQLYMVGHVRFVDKTLLATGGTIGQGNLGLGMRVTAAQLAPDTAVGTACVGDCFDFQLTGVSGRAQVVLPLIFGIRPNSTYRKYNGAWSDFDTTTLTSGAADTLKSAPFTTGTATCPAVGDSAYTPGLTVGNHCVQLDIADNGPNDANPALGTIADPSGVAAGAVVVPVDTRVTDSSGCSLSTSPVNPLERGDWWLLLGFVAWLGLVIRRKRA